MVNQRDLKSWTILCITAFLLLVFASSWVFLLEEFVTADDQDIPERIAESKASHHELSKFGRSSASMNSKDSIHFVQVFTPSLRDLDSCHTLRSCWTVIDEVNQLKPAPKFVMIEAPFRPGKMSEDRFNKIIKKLYKLMTMFKENIILVFVPGEASFDSFTEKTLNEYTNNFGSDHFEFFVNQNKFIVLDSNYDYPSIDAINMTQSRTEHSILDPSSFTSHTLDETKDNNLYSHVIVIRSALKGFNENATNNIPMMTQDAPPSSQSSRDVTFKFLEELAKYKKVTLITFDGRISRSNYGVQDFGQSFDSSDLPQRRQHPDASSLKKEYRNPITTANYIDSIFLATGLSSKCYRLFTVSENNVESKLLCE